MKFRSVVWIVGVLWVGNTIRAEPPSPSATFTKDVLPILQKNCQDCHRPGQLAPMSFLTYRETRPWARAMKLAVISKKMPPWFADSHYGHFLNDRSLSQRDIDTIGAWADAGAPEGDGKDAPQPRVWPLGGWIIEPDLVIKGPEYTVPAHTTNDVMEWTYVTVPSGITKDTWVTSMEIRPDKLAVTHHMCIFFRPHTPDVVYNKAVWVDKPRDASGHVLPKATGAGRRPSFITAGNENPNTDGCYVPGKSVEDYRLYHAAKLIKAGTDVVFQLHYTPNGTEVIDRPQIGLTIAKEIPQRKYISLAAMAATDAESFAIPPNDSNWQSPPVQGTFNEDVELVWMSPHMHVRGKDMTYRLVFPDGRIDTVLSVPRYDFNWQLGYELAEPIKVPKRTKLVVTAHFDNSVTNKSNPDPGQTVYYGEMSWEEMMAPFFSVIADRAVDPKCVIAFSVGR